MNATGNKLKGFLAQMVEYFRRPEQQMADFKVELDALTNQDKLEFWQMLNAAGYPCDPPSLKQHREPPAAA